MKYYFAGNPKGFYSDEVHGDKIPDDKIEITESEYFAIINTPGVKAVGPSGKPEIKPTRWHSLNSAGNAWELTPANQILKDADDSESLRVDEIRVEQNNSELKKITVAQAHAFVDNKLDSATTAPEVKEAIRVILKKMIPHILD